MYIQSLFYLLASIFMIFGIVVMMVILLSILRLKRSADAIRKKAENIKDAIQERKFVGFMPLITTILKWLAERRNKKTA